VEVHAAARIGALAEADQILVSRTTGEHAGDASSCPGLGVAVKGLPDPIQVSEGSMALTSIRRRESADRTHHVA
jgi:class 3 adenylate cyclase